MSKQEMFNKVWKHFVVDKQHKSSRYGGTCLYRGPNNTKCAVGVLIPDDAYNTDMDNERFDNRISSLIKRYPHLKKYVGDDVVFLTHLQRCHDSTYSDNWFTVTMESILKEFAQKFDLTIPEG